MRIICSEYIFYVWCVMIFYVRRIEYLLEHIILTKRKKFHRKHDLAEIWIENWRLVHFCSMNVSVVFLILGFLPHVIHHGNRNCLLRSNSTSYFLPSQHSFCFHDDSHVVKTPKTRILQKRSLNKSEPTSNFRFNFQTNHVF